MTKKRLININRILSVLLAVILVVTVMSQSMKVNVYCGSELADEFNLVVDDGSSYLVKGISILYKNNAYVSMRDVAAALVGTPAEFDLSVKSDLITITKNGKYEILESDNKGWDAERAAALSGHNLQNNLIEVDGESVRYYAMPVKGPGEVMDAYMMMVDLCMLLNIKVSVVDDVHYRISTGEKFVVEASSLEFKGYFQGINAILCGDATTGEIFYEYNGKASVPIASTTKLMTTAIAYDAIKDGRMNYNDKITITENAQKLSEGGDAVMHLTAGNQVTVKEVLQSMLLPSSNESALLMAEYLGGDEAGFIKMMNEEASKLGITSATFYNPHGLPNFSNAVVPAKRHNRMSAEDMFRLASYLLNNHPEIKEISSTQKTNLNSYDNLEIKNTNALLYNLPEITGLKTGTTTKAGACLVTSLETKIDGEPHDLVVVMFGAENTQDRLRFSEIMARYALAVTEGRATSNEIYLDEADEEAMPVKAKDIVSFVVNSVKQ